MATDSTLAHHSKKEMVSGMFDQISHRYDFLNRLLSFGIDIKWRRKAINILREDDPQNILDVATGTGDMALLMAEMLKPASITGIDISPKMLEYGKIKISGNKLDHMIRLLPGDSEDIPFADNIFDAVTVAFGVRNFAGVEKGLSEMSRVLKKGGKAVILEFSLPRKKWIRQLYLFYFNRILPVMGKMISGSDFAYTYLPDSVKKFPQREEFCQIMKLNGFSKTGYKSLTQGICTIYTGIK